MADEDYYEVLGRLAMTSVPRSILLSAIERYGNLVLFLVATAVLSRLLTPTEFGTYAVVNAITAVIAASFQEFGGANYLIQKQELSRSDVRTAFTVTLGLSALVGVLLFTSAGALSRFFAQNSLTNAIEVSTLNFLVTPISGTMSALLRRDLDFGKLTVANLAGSLVGSVTSIALAMAHFSYLAPIWGTVVSNIMLTIMLLRWHRDLGIFRPSLLKYRDVVGFGLYSSGVSIINVFYNLAPQLFLARILDFSSVGLYSRAINLTQVFDRLVTQVLNPVIMPAIAAQRNAGTDLKAVYLDAIRLLSAIQWPFLISIAIMAQPIILIWLGPSWLEIVPLVRILCIANLALFAACLSYPVFVAVGRVRDALLTSLLSLPPSLLVIFLASFFGVKSVAAAALLTLPFQAAVVLYFIGRRLDFGLAEFLGALCKSATVTVVVAAGTAGCAAMIETGIIEPLIGLLGSPCVALLCWWFGLALTRHPLLHRLYQVVGGIAGIVGPRLRPRRSLL
jgi:O-antigen/teichoic acid export membrane protein